MRIPIWYKIECIVWLMTGLPFQFFFTDFNGLSFFSLPDSPGTDGPPVIVWLLSLIFLYHPFFTLPFAIWDGWRKTKNA